METFAPLLVLRSSEAARPTNGINRQSPATAGLLPAQAKTVCY
jgi:hypothetical protein